MNHVHVFLLHVHQFLFSTTQNFFPFLWALFELHSYLSALLLRSIVTFIFFDELYFSFLSFSHPLFSAFTCVSVIMADWHCATHSHFNELIAFEFSQSALGTLSILFINSNLYIFFNIQMYIERLLNSVASHLCQFEHLFLHLFPFLELREFLECKQVNAYASLLDRP